MDVGLELRQARERRGFSLQSLSHRTKISPRVLQAIETSDVNALPAWVFTRAFIRTYAKEVGLDPEDTLRRYLEPFAEPTAESQTAEAASRRETAGRETATDRPDASSPPAGARILHGRFGTATVLILAGIGAVALLARQPHQQDVSTVQPRAVATAGFVPATAQPAPTATIGTTAPAAALHIAIAPTGPCWVQAMTGDTRLFGELLNAGDRKAIDSSSDVTLRVGDPATFAFTINGKPARIGGPAGHAITVHVTRQNFASFLTQ